MLLYLLTVVISLHLVSQSNGLDITDGPYSVNTTLSSTAKFSCIIVADESTVTIDGAVWLVDEVIVNHFPQLTDLGDHRTYSQFDLPAQLNRNESNIQIAVTFTTEDQTTNIFSDKAQLLIQGLLDPPSWEVVEIINGNLTLQWSQPYSIDNVDIVNYHVVVSVNNNTINDTLVSNDTQSLYLNDIAIVEQCTSVAVTISANNEVGESETNTEAIYYLGVPDIAVLNSSLSYSESANITFELATEMQFPCDDLVSPISVDISIYSLTARHNITVNATSDNSSSGVLVTSVTIDNISPHKLYQVDYLIIYNGGETHISNVANISSFDTQFIHMGKSTTDKLCIKCHFLKGTISNGCAIRITEYPVNESSVLLKSENIHNDISNWICTQYSLSFGATTSYEISVFDIEPATYQLTPIMESVYSSHFNALQIVVDDATSIITASGSTIVPFSVSTVTQLHSEGIMVHATSTQSITSKAATVSSVVLITGTQQSSPFINNPVVIAVCVVIGFVLITLTAITVISCLFVGRIVTKMKSDSHRQHLCIPMGTNALYGRGLSNIELKVVDETHVYSEIVSASNGNNCVYATVGKRSERLENDTCMGSDEWIPNPTYSSGLNNGAAALPHSSDTFAKDINQEEVTDSNKSTRILIDTCPAYSLTCDKITENNKHVYEDLTHFV